MTQQDSIDIRILGNGDKLFEGEKRTVESITLEEAKKKKLLGVAGGTDVYHCLHMATQHGPDDFLHTVNYYRICEPGEEPEIEKNCPMVIAFYK